MINVVGHESGPESDAAHALKAALEKAWPWINDETDSFVQIIPNVQCHGENPRDIDIVLLAQLDPKRAQFYPTGDVYKHHGKTPLEVTKVNVRSLCLCIEVKDHPPEGIQFNGPKAEVLYQSRNGNLHWHSVTSQSEGQKYSLKNYIEKNTGCIKAPYICNLIWFRNLPKDELPQTSANFLPSSFTWSGLMNVVIKNMTVSYKNKIAELGSIKENSESLIPQAADLLGRKLEPTTLDRERMDRIAQGSISEFWINDIGNKQLLFQGRGGTGKTAILLSLAWRLWQTKDARILVLTYNRALAADLNRLLTLMGMIDEVGAPLIKVQTVHSFLYHALKALGVVNEYEGDFLANYEIIKDEAFEMLSIDALTSEDLDNMVASDPTTLDWEYIFIDEAQDWPENERDLLHQLYRPERFVVADGKDQYVRQNHSCDWTRGNSKVTSLQVPLSQGLRMKSNLVRFANLIASELGLLSWSIDQNPEAHGGQVIIVEGDYRHAQSIHENVMKNSQETGNSPVDSLMCVPPHLVIETVEGRTSYGQELADQWGFECWDGVRSDTRKNYPTSIDQLRIVQYDSCRGLEGWSLFALGLDRFYEHKLNTAPNPDSEALIDITALHKQYANQWLMIPMTRAIDCLVLNIVSNTSTVGSALKRVAEKAPDFVQWIKV